jgi:hypothetical protein
LVSLAASASPEAAKVLAERRAAAAAAGNAVNAAFANAARIREESGITDPNPMNDVEVSPKGEAKTREYLAAKKAYLNARKASRFASDAVLEVLPPELLKAEIDAAEMKMARAFTRMAALLQNGEIIDPDPENPVSVITSENTAIPANYLVNKDTYLSIKADLPKLRKLLKAAERASEGNGK